jgi:hypothetical protein
MINHFVITKRQQSASMLFKVGGGKEFVVGAPGRHYAGRIYVYGSGVLLASPVRHAACTNQNRGHGRALQLVPGK